MKVSGVSALLIKASKLFADMEVPRDFHGSYDPKLDVTRAKSRSNARRKFALTVIDGLRLIGTTGKPTDDIRLFLFFLHSMESPKRKRLSDLKAGVLMIDQVEPAVLEGTAVRFDLSKGKGIK